MVPKLWTETIETHRREVRDAILDTTTTIVAQGGLLSVTMAQIAEKTGIGRATVYKYFPDVESILLAWHEAQITHHLDLLAQARDEAADDGKRLKAVLEAYALIAQEAQGHHDNELAAFLHRDERVLRAERQLRALLRELLIEGTESGTVRRDIAPDELASFCLHALRSAGSLSSRAAVKRLVMVTMDGLRPAPRRGYAGSAQGAVGAATD